MFAGTEYSNRSDGLMIPKEINHENQTYQVVGIGDNAFYNMTGTEVTLSEGLTYIGAGAFGYSTCKTIEIPASVTRLDKEALHGDFTSITFAEGSKLESIGDRAFRGCDITSLILPSTVKSLGHKVFQACDSLESVEIPASVTEIQTDTFDEYFDADANEGSGNVTFAEGSIFKLQDGVLYDSENLIRVLDWQENVVVPEGIKYIGADAFSAYSTQTPNNMETLKSITLPESLVSIGKNAFQACKALESITIPKNVSEIGGGAFSNCSSLATAEILGPVKELTGTTGVFLGCAALKNVTLPDTLTNIGTGTFNGCASLEKIDLPAGLTEIGKEAFNGCESLKEAIIPDGVTEIPSYAFTGCLALEKVELPEGITSIGEYAFDLTAENDSGEYVNENPKLESINIPSTVTSIAGNFLGGVKANGDTALIFEGENPPTFGSGALDGISGESVNKPTVYYPAEAVDAYTSEDSDLVTNGLVSAPVEGEENSNQYSLAVSPSATSVYENNTINFTVESTLPQDATLMVESSNTKVATAALSSDQKSVTVTGVKEGTATITVSIKLSDVVLASENVTVTVDERGSSGTTRYMVSVEDADNGTIKVSPTRASKGSTVTINVTPDEGYELDKLVVTDKNGDTVKLTDKGSGTYTFKMPASKVTVEATFTQIATEPETLPFTDVKTGDWFYEAVQYVYDKGMMTGVSADRFAPASTTTRGMIVTILYRLENEPAVSGGSAFTDVESGAWYADAVAWAAANDIVNGTSATTFAPNSPITREQMATMLYRFAQYKGMDVVTLQEHLTGYPDGDQVSDYAIPAMNWAVGQGLIAGMENGTLVPQGSATRAQVATILMRFCESIG
ncbi:MAG: leucine-rich repeat protein [Evtepia gabavorous]